MKYLAQTIQGTFGNIAPPPQLQPLIGSSGPSGSINLLLDNVIGIFFTAASISFVLMFLWGAVQMILSGGDKEAIGKARAKITWAIIGITLMALSYFIFQLLQDITGFKFFV